MNKKILAVLALLFFITACDIFRTSIPSSSESIPSSSISSSSVEESSSSSSSSIDTTLTDAKNEAIEELDTFYATFNQNDYDTNEWNTLGNFYNSGKSDINSALTVQDVTTVVTNTKNSINAVLTKLASAKQNALAELDTFYATFSQTNYETSNWDTLVGFYNTGKTEVNAAVTVEEITAVVTDAKNKINAVEVKPIEVNIIKVETYNGEYIRLVTNQIQSTYKTGAESLVINSSSIANLVYFEGPNIFGTTSSITLRAPGVNVAEGDITLNVTFYLTDGTSQNVVIHISNGAIKTLEQSILNALATLDAYPDTKGYIEAKYSTENWTAFNNALVSGKNSINVATSFEEVDSALVNAMLALDNIEQLALQLEEAKTIALAEINDLATSKVETDYTSENWLALQTAINNGKDAVNAAVDINEVNTALDEAKSAINAIEKIPLVFANVIQTVVYSNNFMRLVIDKNTSLLKSGAQSITVNSSSVSIIYYEGPYAFSSGCAITLFANGVNLAFGEITINVTLHFADNTAQTVTVYVSNGNLKTLDYSKANAKQALSSYPASQGYIEAKYSSENWIALNNEILSGQTAIDNATSFEEVDNALAAAKLALDSIEQQEMSLDQVKTLAIAEINDLAASKIESHYTPENWTALQSAKDNGIAAVNSATDLTGIDTAKAAAKDAINAVATNTIKLETANCPWNPHGGSHIVIGWSNDFANATTNVYSASIKDLKTGTIYQANVLHDDGPKAKFFYFPGYNVEDATAHYELTVTITVGTAIYTTTFEVNGRVKATGY